MLALQALAVDPAEAQQRAGRGGVPMAPPPPATIGAIDVPGWLPGSLFAGAAAAMASPLFFRVVGVGKDHPHQPSSDS